MRVKGLKAATLSATSVLALTAMSQTSFAQDVDLIDDDTIIVTGTKQNLTTQEAEVSVDIFDEARLDEESLFRLDDVLTRVPNVTSTGGAGITIRGIGRAGVSGQGVTSNVYLDGAPISSAALQSGFDSVWDIGQIEVLRGPQSTVQGRNALAGAIVLRANDPTYEWETNLRARYATFDTQQFAGSLSGPIIEDELAFRIAADYQATDGFVRNAITLGDQNSSENLLIRGKLLVEPKSIPDLRAEFTVDFTDVTTGILFGTVEAPGDIDTAAYYDFDFTSFSSFAVPEQSDAETLRILTDIEYELNENISFQFIGTYEDYSVELNGGNINDPLEFQASIRNENFFFTEETETYSAELRTYYEFGRWSGSIGGYYFEDASRNRNAFATQLSLALQGTPVVPGDSVLTSFATNSFATQNFAFYGQTRFELNDKWTFDFSIRYDNEDFETPGQFTAPGTVSPASCIIPIFDQTVLDAVLDGAGVANSGLVAPPSCGDAVSLFLIGEQESPQSASFSAILPRGAITYNVNDDVSLFFSGQRGYRAGGPFIFIENAAIQVGQFDPEFLTTYEVGFRSQWFDGDLTFNGNFFYSLYNDQQVNIIGPTGLSGDVRTLNAGESRIYGAEFTGDYRVSDDLAIYGSIGLLETEFLDFPFQEFDPDNPSDFVNLEGNAFPQAPRLSFTIGANYEHPSGFFTNASVAYTGARESDLFNLDENDFAAYSDFLDTIPGRDTPDPRLDTFTERLDSRIVSNARIGYTQDTFSIYIYGTNLFNDQTPIGIGGGTVVGAGTALTGTIATNGVNLTNSPSQTFAPPRIVGLGLDLSF